MAASKWEPYQTIGVQDQYNYNANGVTRYGLGSYWVDNGIVPVPPLKELIVTSKHAKQVTK